MMPNLGIVILAAGLGTRMKSDKAKVLHEICGHPMIEYVVRTANAVAGSNVTVVVGHQAEMVKKTVSNVGRAHFALQEKQLGTGHAVLCALPHISDTVEQVVVLCGDVPLIQPATIQKLVADHNRYQHDVTILTIFVDNPTGYGRIVLTEDGQLTAIVEEADANPDQRKINIINTGIYVISKPFLARALPQLRADNAQNEIYLTDIIQLAYRDNRRIGTVMGSDSNEVMGVNSLAELQFVDKLMKIGRREKS